MTSPDIDTAPIPPHSSEDLLATNYALGEAAVSGLVTNELRERASMVTHAMATELGLKVSELDIVVEELPEGKRRVVAIDASPMGQRIGTYNQIYDKRKREPEWYTVTIDGERIDPLAGCTWSAYTAMIEKAKNRGDLLPDSLALSQQTGEIWTATMLTGEPLTDEGLVQLVSSNSENKVNNVGFPLDRGGKSIRVRPAVTIAEIENT